MLVPIDLPPGVYKNGTEYEAKGRWRDVNLIRWYNGRLRPVGGWQRFSAQPVSGSPRALMTWRSNDATPRLAIGTPSHLYIHDGSLAYDISPSDLVPGRETGNIGLGYGADVYSKSTYGTPRTVSGLVLDATVWDLDTYGQNLIALSPADGRIFMWTPPNTGARAAVIDPTAPTRNRGVIVTDERFVVALGANGDPRNITWCSQEDYTQWTATATNTAGSLQLNTNGVVMNARRMPGETLIFTDLDVHSMRFEGTPFVYGIQRVGSSCGLIGRKAHAATQNFCVWMGPRGFFLYDGVVRPLACDVQEHVFDNINPLQASKVIAGVNAQFSEIWWFYPSLNSNENDRYVVWNYVENWWSVGKLQRTAWSDRDVWPYPIAADANGVLYQHEQGWTDSGVTRVGQVYAESGPFDLGNGDNLLCAKQLLPDTNVGGGASLAFTFKTRFTPTGAETTAGPYLFTRPDGYVDVRFTGRQAKLRIEARTDALFQFGTLRVDGDPGGRR